MSHLAAGLVIAGFVFATGLAVRLLSDRQARRDLPQLEAHADALVNNAKYRQSLSKDVPALTACLSATLRAAEDLQGAIALKRYALS